MLGDRELKFIRGSYLDRRRYDQIHFAIGLTFPRILLQRVWLMAAYRFL